MNKRTIRILMLITAVLAALMVVSCNSGGNDAELIEQHKKLAGELRDAKLYDAAIQEYDRILTFNQPDTRTRANINYLMARIYFENLQDYKQAAAYYIRARALDPEASFVNEASRNLVTSLEKMGNILDARRELDAATNIDAPAKAAGDREVARIGETPVYLSEVEEQIQTLPPQVQKQLVNHDEKLQFVHQYVGMELMFRAAERENYGENPEVKKQMRELYKNLLLQRYMQDKVMPQIKIDTLDVRNYYAANKTTRYNGAPYDSVRAQVFMDYQGEKAEQAFSEYIGKLAQTERVQFFDRNVK